MVLPRLERGEATFAATTSANDVRMAIQSVKQELRQLAQQCETSPSPVIVYPNAIARLARHPEMGPNKEGLFRVLYHIEREVGRHRANSSSSMALRSTSLRIPTSQDTMLER